MTDVVLTDHDEADPRPLLLALAMAGATRVYVPAGLLSVASAYAHAFRVVPDTHPDAAKARPLPASWVMSVGTCRDFLAGGAVTVEGADAVSRYQWWPDGVHLDQAKRVGVAVDMARGGEVDLADVPFREVLREKGFTVGFAQGGLWGVGAQTGGKTSCSQTPLAVRHIPGGFDLPEVEPGPYARFPYSEHCLNAYRAALRGDANAAGESLDKAWAVWRQCLIRVGAVVTPVDLAYADARGNGSRGGLPSADGLYVVTRC